MAKLYTKGTTVVDEVLSGAERYDIKENAGTAFKSNMQIVLATGVSVAGTAINAARLNNIENGIDAVDTRVDNLNTTVVDANNLLTTGGTTTAYTLTTTGAAALATGERFRVKFNATAGATPTLNRDSKGAKSLKYYDSTGTKQACTSSNIVANLITDVVYDGTDYVVMDPAGVTGSNGSANNYMNNGSFGRFERLSTPSTPVSMTDNVYNGPDRWYSLIQGSGPTIAQAAGIGTTPYSCKIVMGGTTNRAGIAQIFKSERSIPLRGKTVTFQILAKPTNNAGSGTRKYRVALIEWTGTADTIGTTPHDLVASWTSSTFTLSNFFEGTTKTLVGTASFTVSHGVETVLSITGTISSSCNNLIAFVWTEDAPIHASDYLQLGEAGLREATTTQSWSYVPNDDDVCLEHCRKIGATTGQSIAAGLMDSTSVLLCFILFGKPMFAAPTFSYGSAIGDWSIRYTGSGVSVCTALTQGNSSKYGATLSATATGTPLTAGQAGQLRAVNTNAYLLFEAEL